MRKSKITKGEKRLIGAVAGSLVLILSGALYRYYLDVDPVLNIPKPAMPSPNGFDYYIKAGKMEEALWHSTPGSSAVEPITDVTSHVGMTPQQLAQLYPTTAKEAWVKKNAPTLRLLRQGFAYQSRYPSTRSSETNFPFYAQGRSLARLLVIESHARAERGNWAGASRSALDILRLGHDMPRGGALIGGLVGCAVNAIGCRQLSEVLPHLDAGASRIASAEIERLHEGRVTLDKTLEEEKWKGQASLLEMLKVAGWRASFLEMIRRGERAASLLLGGATSSDPVDWKTRARLEVLSKRRIMSNFTSYADAAIVQAKKPYALRQTVPIPDDPVNEIMVFAFQKAGWNMARDEAGNTTLAVQFALCAFKLERGSFPAFLKELVPSYLKKVPLDPFGGGQTLRYRKIGKSYLLYSIGPDGKDDGGKPIDDASRANASSPDVRYIMNPDSKGDYVAGINR